MSPSFGQSVVRNGDFSPAINVLNWFIAVVTAFFVGARVTTKLIRSLRIGRDDMIVLVSTLFSFALVATATIQTANGLGKRVDSLSSQQLITYQKAEYAGDIFYVLSLMLSKFSVILLLYLITPMTLHIRLVIALGCAIILWGVSAFLVSLFQCNVHGVWQLLGSQCVQKISFWTYFGISNIMVEVALITLPMYIIQNVHVMHSAKTMVTTCFALRLFVIGCIIPQIIFLRRLSNSVDPTLDSWPVVVCSLFVQSFSIITACIPYLKPFFSSLESGMLRTDDLRRRDGTSTFSSNNPNLNSNQIIRWSRKPKQNGGSKGGALNPWPQMEEVREEETVGQNTSATTEVVTRDDNRKVAEGDIESQTSRSNFIQQTGTWEPSHTLDISHHLGS